MIELEKQVYRVCEFVREKGSKIGEYMKNKPTRTNNIFWL